MVVQLFERSRQIRFLLETSFPPTCRLIAGFSLAPPPCFTLSPTRFDWRKLCLRGVSQFLPFPSERGRNADSATNLITA